MEQRYEIYHKVKNAPKTRYSARKIASVIVASIYQLSTHARDITRVYTDFETSVERKPSICPSEELTLPLNMSISVLKPFHGVS